VFKGLRGVVSSLPVYVREEEGYRHLLGKIARTKLGAIKKEG
jgi:hypothetical protein